MNTNNRNNTTNPTSSRMWAGLIIVIIGLFLLAGQLNMGHIIPPWIRSWQVIMIVVGLAIGGSSNFRNPASFILIGMGTIFLIQKFVYFNIWKLAFPLAIIVLGIWLLTDNNRRKFFPNGPNGPNGGPYRRGKDPYYQGEHTHFNTSDHAEDVNEPFNENTENNAENPYKNTTSGSFNENFLNSTAIFSEEKKILTTKNLQGGEVLNIFGGTDINLLQADIQEPIVIDVFQIFAGTKIIVPAHWKVHSKVISIFGEVDDRRIFQESSKSDKKIIYLKGTSIFGGITIKSM